MSFQLIYGAAPDGVLAANDPGAFKPQAGTHHDQSLAEHIWEDEGGCHIDPARMMYRCGSVDAPIVVVSRLAQQVAAMSDQLTTDFVNAKFGTRLKTLAQRSRVLRQLKARLKIEQEATALR